LRWRKILLTAGEYSLVQSSTREVDGVRPVGIVHKLGYALIGVAIVVFVFAFLRTAGAQSGSCSGSDCLKGDMRWALLIPGAILVFVAGFLLLYFGGKGYGRTSGPRSFGDVDSGKWAPREREPLAQDGAPRRRWTRTWRNTYLAVGVGELGLALLFAITAIAQPSTARGFLPVTVILAVIGVVFVFLGWRALQKDRLHDRGLAGEATVAGVQQTGMWMNENPYVQLDLVVRVPGHQPYEVKHNEIVPQIALGRLTSGEPLPVRVDSNDPSHLVVQWERL
jgi:hypothetical protein